ncbi:MAG: hypothetical protein BGO86_00180 [Chryseobacterium sp. 36-9]|nr:MAG: hypothetical protein BGO86_00180 [Chryseobacterium sp. 36-9]
MNKFSFDIKTSDDFYNKLKEDYNEFCTKETSSRIALNCAMTAWHLSEWIYNEYRSTKLISFNKFEFHENIKLKCPSLQIMQDLSNGTKHTKITKYTPNVTNTEKHEGTFDYTFDFTFDTSSLNIELANGTKTEFSVEMQKCIDFYESYFSNFLKKI